MSEPKKDPALLTSDAEVRAELRRLSRRGFLAGGMGAVAAVAGWKWLRTLQQDDGIAWPLRRGLQFNERVTQKFFDPKRLTHTFDGPADAIPRENGDLGLVDVFRLSSWRLEVENTALPGGKVALDLERIRAFPRAESISYLMCIEGWADKGRWAGARFIDFMRAYPPRTRSGRAPDIFRHPEDLPRYVGFETPDGEYYVGLDMASAMHPQTLLCYEMGGEPLTRMHGAPLRLYVPVKYGIKSLKCIGRIFYTETRPPDYWAENGYDYYAGL